MVEMKKRNDGIGRGWDRTTDLVINSHTHCQLCYPSLSIYKIYKYIQEMMHFVWPSEKMMLYLGILKNNNFIVHHIYFEKNPNSEDDIFRIQCS